MSSSPTRQVRDILIRDVGKFVVAASQTFTVEGVWSNAATVVAESGSFLALGGDTGVTARVYGNSSFAGLECVTPGKRIEFATNRTTAVTGTLRFNGAPGTNVVLRSMANDTAWLLNVSAAARAPRGSSCASRSRSVRTSPCAPTARGGSTGPRS